MSIEVIGIRKYYGDQPALNGVSFSVASGEIAGFIGPNGAGKTTMMKILTGFLPPSSGEVRINGSLVTGEATGVKRQVGYLPENNPLYPDMYVLEYLRYVAGIYRLGKKTRERIREMIQLTGLVKEQGKKIGALSKGYRQRLGLAQALIHDPSVLILDEPTSGLDPNQIVEIRHLISRAGKEKTVLLSTHIMQEVEAICDRIIIINQGNIVADEARTNIYGKAERNVQTTLVEFNAEVHESALAGLEGVLTVKPAGGNRWLIQSGTDKDIRGDLFNFAVSNNLQVLSMQKQEKSLEEVFRELTKE